MKRIILFVFTALCMFACEPRVEMDRAQWELEAEITNAFIYTWEQKEVELPDGTKIMATTKVTVSSDYDVDSENATIEITLKDGVDRTALSAYFYHTGKEIKPLDNAPALGELKNWSANTYKYRVLTEGELYKDWTINIK